MPRISKTDKYDKKASFLVRQFKENRNVLYMVLYYNLRYMCVACGSSRADIFERDNFLFLKYGVGTYNYKADEKQLAEDLRLTTAEVEGWQYI